MIENTHAAESFDALFARLATSEFRRRFRLKAEDIAYIERKGMETIRRHAADFVRTRLAPAVIPNDGRQTPMLGKQFCSRTTRGISDTSRKRSPGKHSSGNRYGTFGKRSPLVAFPS